MRHEHSGGGRRAGDRRFGDAVSEKRGIHGVYLLQRRTGAQLHPAAAAGYGDTGCDAAGHRRFYAVPHHPREVHLSGVDADRQGGGYGQDRRADDGRGRLCDQAVQPAGAGGAGKSAAAAVQAIQPAERAGGIAGCVRLRRIDHQQRYPRMLAVRQAGGADPDRVQDFVDVVRKRRSGGIGGGAV